MPHYYDFDALFDVSKRAMPTASRLSFAPQHKPAFSFRLYIVLIADGHFVPIATVLISAL